MHKPQTQLFMQIYAEKAFEQRAIVGVEGVLSRYHPALSRCRGFIIILIPGSVLLYKRVSHLKETLRCRPPVNPSGVRLKTPSRLRIYSKLLFRFVDILVFAYHSSVRRSLYFQFFTAVFNIYRCYREKSDRNKFSQIDLNGDITVSTAQLRTMSQLFGIFYQRV